VTTRFWVERPDRLRSESEHVVGRTRATMQRVQVGATWWVHHDRMGSFTNAGSSDHPLGLFAPPHVLDPSPLLAGFDLAPGARTELGGRAGLRLSARARPHEARRRDPAQDPALAGDHELVIDAERGIVLEDTVLLDGQPATRLVLDELVFDEAIPPETFVFRPPAGERLRTFWQVPAPAATAALPLLDAARSVPFTVFALDGGPDDWALAAILPPGHLRRGQTPRVDLVYRRRERPADAKLSLSQQAADPRERLPPPAVRGSWRTQTSAGLTLHLSTFEYGGPVPQHLLLTVRDGTRLQLESAELGFDELIALVGRLGPVSTGSPRPSA
jgi:hypothetical protein